jgi:nitric-oxide synthase
VNIQPAVTFNIAQKGEDIADANRDRLAEEATRFYSMPEVREITPGERLRSVLLDISVTGSYTQTYDELLIGARLAWRNHARCVGRYSWRTLTLIDARSCETAGEVAQACWKHLRVSTNRGKVRPVVTVFRPYQAANRNVRLLNHELVRYAGHKQPDGSVVGDPQYVAITEMATSLGWRGSGSAFDVLPLIISVDGKPPEMLEVPADCVLEVPIRHPRFDWFEELNLRWHANPAVSDMCLEVGGLRYTAAPFTGWYVNPEIAARNLGDTYRYNMLPVIAQRMGLDVRHKSSLWIDRALLELNEAVLYSFAAEGVYIVDHHTAAAQFMAHVERENAAGRTVPTDWAWINPPMSSSTVATFNRTFDPPDPHARPNFCRQDSADVPPERGAGERSCPHTHEAGE